MRIEADPEGWPSLTDPERGDDDGAFVVDVAGFEGPLDLLLDLARRQKVDLHEISILALADQYIAFVETARTMRIELAADYLVMAAWLAFLKSRLLLPEPPKAEGPSATELASSLAARLRHLHAIREAARLLDARPRLGRDLFGRGAFVEAGPDGAPSYDASLHDLLSAYARQHRRRVVAAPVAVGRRPVWSLEEARDALSRLLGGARDWVGLDTFLLGYAVEPGLRPSALASGFAAALEIVREGRASIRQDEAFGPLMIRRSAGPEPVPA